MLSLITWSNVNPLCCPGSLVPHPPPSRRIIARRSDMRPCPLQAAASGAQRARGWETSAPWRRSPGGDSLDPHPGLTAGAGSAGRWCPGRGPETRHGPPEAAVRQFKTGPAGRQWCDGHRGAGFTLWRVEPEQSRGCRVRALASANRQPRQGFVMAVNRPDSAAYRTASLARCTAPLFPVTTPVFGHPLPPPAPSLVRTPKGVGQSQWSHRDLSPLGVGWYG
jgi:hypothetical protein